MTSSATLLSALLERVPRLRRFLERFSDFLIGGTKKTDRNVQLFPISSLEHDFCAVEPNEISFRGFEP